MSCPVLLPPAARPGVDNAARGRRTKVVRMHAPVCALPNLPAHFRRSVRCRTDRFATSTVGGLLLVVSALLFIYILARAQRRRGALQMPSYRCALPYSVNSFLEVA